MCGTTGEGFELTAGVRQGCPLSPLLFCIVTDVLLRRLAFCVPHAVLRAYADDLAMVLRRGCLELQILETLFTEYWSISRLGLHHGKSVWVALSLSTTAATRA